MVDFAPKVRLDLKTASREAFAATVGAFNKEAAAAPRPASPFPSDGWYDITPEMAEVALACNAGNREVSLPQVKKNAIDMEAGNWQPTGETVVFNEKGALNDGQQRLWAGYLSNTTFRSYVVVSAPVINNLFAYYDCGKGRTAADALYTAGLNGLGKVIARAISELIVRYDHDALAPVKTVRFRPVDQREVLAYVGTHPDFINAVHLMFGYYPDAVRVIGSKQTAAFFAWLVVRAYGDEALERFCRPLGSGANLMEDDPILVVRERLMLPPEDCTKMPSRTRLALLNKAFLMHVNGQKLARSRGGKVSAISLRFDEPFPKIEAPAALAA